MDNVRLIAFDLDGTLTQHKTKLAQPNLGVLNALRAKYKLLMVGAGMCSRIFSQMNGYPIDIIGNYGMQFCTYNAATGELDHVFDEHAPCDRASVEARVTALRERFGYTVFKGNNVEYHDSGCVTFPLLGTAADIADKLAFDPDRAKRKPMYPVVRDAFPDYTVFIGGSSSFDLAPFPYNNITRSTGTAPSMAMTIPRSSMSAMITVRAATMRRSTAPTSALSAWMITPTLVSI